VVSRSRRHDEPGDPETSRRLAAKKTLSASERDEEERAALRERVARSEYTRDCNSR
jgi:hypothetical protein